MKRFSFLLAIFLILQPAAWPHWPVPEKVWMTTSANGKYLFKMVPAPPQKKDGEEGRPKAYGIAYAIGGSGTLHEIWRAEGWYAFEGHLADDGEHLVGLAPRRAPHHTHEHPVVAFYHKGVRLRQYEAHELISDIEVENAVERGEPFFPRSQSKPRGFRDGLFHLVMADKSVYDFDFTDGSIAKSGRDELAESWPDPAQSLRHPSEKKAIALFRESPFREEFRQAFKVSSFRVNDDDHYLYHFGAPVWEASLEPREEVGHHAAAHLRIVFTPEEPLATTHTSESIVLLIKQVVEHPFVNSISAADGSSWVCLWLLGDCMHQSSHELADLHKKRSEIQKFGGPERWVEFSMFASTLAFVRIFLNVDTGHILYRSAGEEIVILIDANGRRIQE